MDMVREIAIRTVPAAAGQQATPFDEGEYDDGGLMATQKN
jgi:hypothetical protein